MSPNGSNGIEVMQKEKKRLVIKRVDTHLSRKMLCSRVQDQQDSDNGIHRRSITG